MKKRIYVCFLIAVALLTAFSFSSCKGKEFTVTFDGNGGSLISGAETQTVKEGDGVTPPTYERAGYTLSWGDFSFDEIAESATLKAVWTPVVYTITYELDGGTNHAENPSTYTVESPSITLQAPTKATRVFVGFSEGSTIPAKSTGNKTFTAIWTPAQYTYTFFDEDGTTVLKTATADYGSAIVAPAAPTKAATAQYTYIFSSWGKAIPASLTANISFTANYSQTVNQYTYTFFDEDGTTVLKTTTLDYGTEIDPPAAPTKAATAQYTYIFSSWDKIIPETLTANITFTAAYSQTVNQYTYTFFDEDGATVLKTATLDYGTEIVPPTAPTKAATAQYTYIFSSWDKTIPETLTANITFTAVYSETVNQYTYTFFDEDGTTVLKTVTADYGTEIVTPATPTKAATAQYTYIFSSWSKAIPASLTANISFAATYSQIVNQYRYIFYDENGTTVLKTVLADYGSEIVPPDDAPTKEATTQYTYTFSGWDKDIPDTLTANIDFIAVYSSQLNRYTVSFETRGGSTLSDFVGDYGTKVPQPADPTKEDTVFLGWTQYMWGRYLYDFELLLTADITLYAFWAELQYSFLGDDTGYEVVGIGDFTDAETVVVPSTYNDLPVVGIRDYAFSDNTTLRQATIKEGIKYIGTGAFSSCSSLVGITLPSSLETISGYAFSYSNLESVTIPEGIIAINNGTFRNCANLTSVTLPSTLQTIGVSAFESSGLESITIPDSVTTIGEHAFFSCSSLISAEIAAETIGKGCFVWCTNLETVSLSYGIKTLGESAFSSCAKLTSIILPSSIETIGEYVFSSTGLSEITIPGSIKNLPKSSFSHNYSLSSVTFENGIESIGDFVFYSSNLSSVVLPDSVKTLGLQAFSHSNNLSMAVIGSGIESLGNNVFSGAMRIVTIKASVPPVCGETPFGYGISSVYVPAASVDQYKAVTELSYCSAYILAMPSVTFDTKDGSAVASIVDLVYGDSIQAPEPPQKDHNTFNGWFIDEECLTSYTFGTPVTSNITLYAKWIIDEYTYTFYGENGTPTLIAVMAKYGSEIFPPDAPTKAATAQYTYIFSGWDKEIPSALTENITFTAVYLATINQYTYTFLDDDYTELKSVSADYGSQISPPNTPTKTATAQYTYTFSGWDIGIPAELTEDITFTAEYSATINQYTYTFFDDDYTELKSVSADYGSEIVPPDEPTKDATAAYSYTFSGWDIEIPAALTENVYIMAQYTETLNQYTYTFYDDDEVTVLKTDLADYGSAIVPPDAPSKTPTAEYSFEFNNWDKELPVSLTANITFIAQYVKTPIDYTVTFYSNGGSDVEPILQAFGTSINTPAEPLRTGYTFDGWYMDNGTFIISCPKKMPAADITLYTRWAPKQNCVYFDSNGGSGTMSAQMISIGSTAALKSNTFMKSGYYFTGWATDESSEAVYSDRAAYFMGLQASTLYAVWEPCTDTSQFSFEAYGPDAYNIKIYNGSSSTVAIPGEYNGKPVIGILTYAFYNKSGIQKVIFPNTIQTIGIQAFNSCSGLTSLILPEGLLSVSDYAFANCNNVTDIYLPSTLTSTGYGSFAFCTKLESITIPDSVTSLGANSFESTAVVSATIGSGVSNIPDGVFASCPYLNTVTVNRAQPPSLVWAAFYGCPLTAIYVPEGSVDAYKTTNDWNAVEYKNIIFALGSPSFTVQFDSLGGSEVTNISAPARRTIAAPVSPLCSGKTFDGWYKEAEYINIWNFDTDTVASNITLYAKWLMNVTFDTVGGSALPTLYVEYGSTVSPPGYSFKSGYTFDNWYKEADYITVWDFDVDTVTEGTTLYAKWIPLSGTEGLLYSLINDDTEYQVIGYEGSSSDVVIPLSYNGLPVKIIGFEAFRENTTIQTLTTYGISAIDPNAFFLCENLAFVSLNENLVYIGRSAFDSCPLLLSISIPLSVEFVDADAFYDESGKTMNIYCAAAIQPTGWSPWWMPSSAAVVWSSDGVKRTYSFETYGGSAVDPMVEYSVLSVPISEKDGYYFGGWYDNADCWGQPVIFPYFSKTVLHLYAKWLEEQPGGPATEGLDFELIAGGTQYRVIDYTGTSETVFIPSVHNGLPVTEVYHFAFGNNNYITGVTIGNGICSIGSSAFINCPLLESVVIGNGVTSIGSQAFDRCVKLTSIIIPEGVETINESVFSGCTSLASVILPNTVTRIESFAFENCPISSLVIPEGVSYIGYMAFSCPGLTSVTVEAEVPPSLYIYNPTIFGNSSPLIYVPAASVAEYKTAQGWSSLTDYIFAIS